ncbi:MAG: response regulator [Magnetococcales bacterium]|nr:response regulator [Magnetococcales bacterium]
MTEEILFRLGNRFEIYTAQDIYMAVRIIKRVRPGIIVSEINLDEINGISFLLKMQSLMPNIVAMLLTGEKNPDALAQAKEMAGDIPILKKNIEHPELTRILTAAVELYRQRNKSQEVPAQKMAEKPVKPGTCSVSVEEDKGREEEMVLKLVKEIQIPSQPKLVMDIYREIKKKEPSFSVIANLVSQDAGLAARIIRIVNSPYYGRPTPVKSITHALTTLGINNFYKVVLTASLRELMSKGMDAKDFEKMWNHMLMVARVSEFIAIWMRTSVSPEQAYLTGLFHDSSMCFLLSKKAGYRKIILEELKCSHQNILATEMDFIGNNHAVIGGWMGKEWGQPKAVYTAIRHHHNHFPPTSQKSDDAELWFVLRLAEYLLDTILVDKKQESLESFENQGLEAVGFTASLLQMYQLKADDILNLMNDIVDIVEL